MKIEHIAIWVKDLDKMKSFYVNVFEAVSNQKYSNDQKKFSSYFLSFKNGARLELMHQPDVLEEPEKQYHKSTGLAHFAVSVGSKERVESLTESIRNKGYDIIGEPRRTGDGYYESIISDPEGNLIEITI